MTQRTFYVTTPIYYVNDIPHIGHAYTTLACDVLARFKRLDGYDTFFLTGTDEHGIKNYQAARDKGRAPQDHVDEVSKNFRALSPLLNFSNDDFIRTTEPRHIKAAQDLWKKLEAVGDIYLGKYEGWYSVRDEAYYDESELSDGPDGTKLAPTGAPCEWQEEESYFFKLSEWQDRLLDFYEAHPDFVQPASRYNEVKSFVKGGLKDLSISRTTFDWGVPVPGNGKHVMYVWIDALTNYMTAVGYPDQNSESFKKFWPADVHVIGKDILRFHAVYWPAFLLSAGLPVVKKVFAHGWWTIEGQKMSKSLGNVIAPQDLVDQYGLDQSRYALLRKVPFGNDGDFSHDQVVALINSDLANNLGNLCQRTLSMIAKNCDGKVPEWDLTNSDNALLQKTYTLLERVRPLYDELAFSKILDEIWSVCKDANEYIDAQAPWTLKKENPVRMATVLYVLAEAIRNIALLVQPFMPDSAGKILDQLAVAEEQRTFEYLGQDHALLAGTELPAPEAVFPRHVEDHPDEAAHAG